MVVEVIHDHPGVIIDGVEFSSKHVSEDTLISWQIAVGLSNPVVNSIHFLLSTVDKWAHDPSALEQLTKLMEVFEYVRIRRLNQFQPGQARESGGNSETLRAAGSAKQGNHRKTGERDGRQASASATGESLARRIMQVISADFPHISRSSSGSMGGGHGSRLGLVVQSGTSGGCVSNRNVPSSTKGFSSLIDWL